MISCTVLPTMTSFDGGPVDDRLYGGPSNDTLSGGQGTTIDVDWVYTG